MKDFLAGIGYLLRGFDLIRRPGWRRYAAAPVAVSLLVFVALVGALAWGFDVWMAVLLPAGWGWLEWLLWPLFAVVIVLVWVFAFFQLTFLVGAPFNDLLSEKVQAHAGAGTSPEGGWLGLLREGPRAVAGAAQALVYSLLWAAPLLLLSLVPVVNLAAPVLWLFLNAWLLAIEYADYPLGARGYSFRQKRAAVRAQRPVALGFGLATLVAMAVPVLNLAAMPAAVAGSTLLYSERHPALAGD
ncbi:sulfate transporter CysZ [Thiohalorhabdus sp.]|uniref:sulfate transporter CysZ n=1 Tax=Thiohalorhabdus sp. TaxID=3094134 RepID=UPI002FC3126D